MRFSLQKQSLSTILLFATLAGASVSQVIPYMGGPYGPLTTTAPVFIPAIGLTAGSATGTFPGTAHQNWIGSFNKTPANLALNSAPGSGTGQNSTAAVSLTFSSMPIGYLPEGTYMHFGDVDSGNWEVIKVTAYDLSGAQVTSPWLARPVWYFGPDNSSTPQTPIGTITSGQYTFQGQGPMQPTKTLILRTIIPISRIDVIKEHDNNGFGISAPPPLRDALPECCERVKNVIPNPSFNSGNRGFTTDQALDSSTFPNYNFGPNEYRIVTGIQAWQIGGWSILDQGTNDAFIGNFLLASLSPSPTVVWRQTLNLPAGEYTFCARVKPLSNKSGANGTAKVEFRFNGASNGQTYTSSANPTDWKEHWACYDLYNAGPVTVEIVCSAPAGNRAIAIDNVSLQMKQQQSNPYLVLPQLSTQITGTSTYGVTAAVPNLPTDFGWYWSVKNLTDNTEISNPSDWWVPHSPNNFKNYLGTNALASTGLPGKFEAGKKYRITYGIWSKCTKWRSSVWDIEFSGAFKQDAKPTITRRPDLEQSRGPARLLQPIGTGSGVRRAPPPMPLRLY